MVMSMDHNYKMYRELLKTETPPMVPFIGVLLHDMVFISDGNDDFRGKMINIEKHRMVYNIVSLLLRGRRSEYSLSRVSIVVDYITSAPKWDDKRQYERSLEAEPRGIRVNDLRKLGRIDLRDLSEFTKPDMQETKDAAFYDEISARMETAHFARGEYIVVAGDAGDSMFFISKGSVECIIGNGISTVHLHRGDFFGEISLLFDEPRSASVRATTDVRLRVLDRVAFDDVVARYPHMRKQFRRVGSVRKSRQASDKRNWLKQLSGRMGF